MYFVVMAVIIAIGCIEVGSRSSDKQEQSTEEGVMTYCIIGPSGLSSSSVSLYSCLSTGYTDWVDCYGALGNERLSRL